MARKSEVHSPTALLLCDHITWQNSSQFVSPWSNSDNPLLLCSYQTLYSKNYYW